MEDDVQNVEANRMQASRQEVVQSEERRWEVTFRKWWNNFTGILFLRGHSQVGWVIEGTTCESLHNHSRVSPNNSCKLKWLPMKPATSPKNWAQSGRENHHSFLDTVRDVTVACVLLCGVNSVLQLCNIPHFELLPGEHITDRSDTYCRYVSQMMLGYARCSMLQCFRILTQSWSTSWLISIAIYGQSWVLMITRDNSVGLLIRPVFGILT